MTEQSVVAVRQQQIIDGMTWLTASVSISDIRRP
jgi:hypothetical protein